MKLLKGEDAYMTRLMLDDPYAIPLSEIDPSIIDLHIRESVEPYLRRLRNEDPVHYCENSEFGPYWSITKYDDIRYVDSNHRVFSSDGAVMIDDDFFTGERGPGTVKRKQFITMDPPQHGEQRKAVSPALAPGNIATMEAGIRERARAKIDQLPVGETFDWVHTVATDLTLQMLAILLDFPMEESTNLLRWSYFAVGVPGDGMVESWEQRDAVLRECAARFMELWTERRDRAAQPDLISMLAHSPATRDMPLEEFIGNITQLIVGGNDTTRNTMTGSVLALHRFPDQMAKLKSDPSLIASMVPEAIRWQTPVTYQRRTATCDTILGGKTIHAGDKVVMWYLSGNRDEDVIDRPDEFIVDRAHPRQHLSFGFGIHRCVGNRLAELQLRVLWEELLPRVSRIEVMDKPGIMHSNVLRGYTSLPVQIYV